MRLLVRFRSWAGLALVCLFLSAASCTAFENDLSTVDPQGTGGGLEIQGVIDSTWVIPGASTQNSTDTTGTGGDGTEDPVVN